MLTFDINLDLNQFKYDEELVSDLRDFWKEDAIRLLKPAFARLFEREGAARSLRRQFQTWDRLAPATMRQKQKLYPNQKILQRTGRLFRSLTQNPVVVLDPLEMSYRTHVRYVVFHELGTRHLPQRSIFERVAVTATPILQSALVRYLNKKTKEMYS